MDIALGRLATLDEVREALRQRLPGVMLHVTDDPDLGAVPPNDLLVSLAANPSEFPTGLRVFALMMPGCDLEDWLRDLAEALSIQLRTRTICDGSPFGDTDAPYWSLVWDIGQPFLADDCGTLISDGEGGPVRIVRPLTLPSSHIRPPLADRIARSRR